MYENQIQTFLMVGKCHEATFAPRSQPGITLTLGPDGTVAHALSPTTTKINRKLHLRYICYVLLYGLGGVGFGSTCVQPPGQLLTYG